jgi:hypothetical protein
MSNYYNKYLKYKNKYLQLKNQTGGDYRDVSVNGHEFQVPSSLIDSSGSFDLFTDPVMAIDGQTYEIINKIGGEHKMTYKIVVTFELLDRYGNKLNNKNSNDQINEYLQSIYEDMIYNAILDPFIEETDFSSLLILNNFAENDFKLIFLFNKNPIDESLIEEFFRLFIDGLDQYEILLDTEQDGIIKLEQFFISNYRVVSDDFQTIELSYQALVKNSLSIENTNEIVGDKLYKESTRGDMGLILANYNNSKEEKYILRIKYNIQTKNRERVTYMPQKAIDYINLISSNKLILAEVKVEDTHQENTYWVELLIFSDIMNREQFVYLTDTYKFFLEHYNEDTFVDGIKSITPENFFLNESVEIIDYLTYKELLDLTDLLDYKVYTIRLSLEFEASEIPELDYIRQKYLEWIQSDKFIESGQLNIFPITFKFTYI